MTQMSSPSCLSLGGHDVSGVQAYVGGSAAEACTEMGARAYAVCDYVGQGLANGLVTACGICDSRET